MKSAQVFLFVAAMAGGALGAAGVTRAQTRYVCTVVDALAPGYDLRETYFYDVNELGVACGRTTIAQIVGGGTSISATDFYWSLAGGSVAFENASAVSGINNAGQIAGAGRLFHIPSGAFTTLPELPGTFGPPVMSSINDAGTAVGYIKLCNCSNSSGLFQIPYVWDAQLGPRTIEFPGARSAIRVNAAGVVVGEIKVVAGVPEAFVHDLTSGATTLLAPYFPGSPPFESWTLPADINDSGVVVGEHRSPSTGYTLRGFTWSPAGGLTMLPEPGPGLPPDLRPASINESGVVVGHAGYSIAASRAFVWDAQNGLTDLNLVSAGVPAGFVLKRATRINDAGLIVGWGQGGGGYSKGFVLTPIDACYADCNGDGILSVADFGCFQTRFIAAEPYADCNEDGTLSVADFACFQTAFVQGCP